jgi:hypothetical protein
MTTRGTALAAAAGAAAITLVVAGMTLGVAQAQQGAGQGNGPGPRAAAGSAGVWGAGATSGPQRRARGDGGTGTSATVTAELTAGQRADLLAMVEEEKLAGDVYDVLGDRFDDATLERIAASEDRHAAALRRLLDRYGIADPTAGLPVGEFATTEFQQLYDRLVAEGATSLAAAYDVGEQIERLDIDDLTDAIATAQGRADLVRVYSNLRTGSTHHLAAFTR